MTQYSQKDVEVCVNNSTRLFEDAFRRLLPPTRYGILELSVEEMTKAWWVHFVVNPEQIFPGLEKINYSKRLEEKFGKHDVKVSEMQALTNIIITRMRNKPPSPSNMESTVKDRVSKFPEYKRQQRRVDPKIANAANNPETLENLLKWMESVTKIDTGQIPKIKENAFYVSKSKDGLIPPASSYEYSLLAWMCVFNAISKEILTGDESGLADLFKLVTRDREIFNVIKRIVPTARR